MYLIPQITMRTDDSVVLMAHLSEDANPASDLDTDIEIVFREGLVDGSGESPDFVVPREELQRMLPSITLDFPDQNMGMVLRITAPKLDLANAIDWVIFLIAGRCKRRYGKIELCGLRVVA
jgi:hypothetical protein